MNRHSLLEIFRVKTSQNVRFELCSRTLSSEKESSRERKLICYVVILK